MTCLPISLVLSQMIFMCLYEELEPRTAGLMSYASPNRMLPGLSGSNSPLLRHFTHATFNILAPGPTLKNCALVFI